MLAARAVDLDEKAGARRNAQELRQGRQRQPDAVEIIANLGEPRARLDPQQIAVELLDARIRAHRNAVVVMGRVEPQGVAPAMCAKAMRRLLLALQRCERIGGHAHGAPREIFRQRPVRLEARQRRDLVGVDRDIAAEEPQGRRQHAPGDVHQPVRHEQRPAPGDRTDRGEIGVGRYIHRPQIDDLVAHAAFDEKP